MPALDVVQRQLEAYNAHNLEAFAACYAEDIQMFRMPSTEPMINGKAALKEFYGANRFMSPSLCAEILNRIVIGNKVIDHELVTGAQKDPFEVVVIYEVQEELIKRAWSVWPL